MNINLFGLLLQVYLVMAQQNLEAYECTSDKLDIEIKMFDTSSDPMDVELCNRIFSTMKMPHIIGYPYFCSSISNREYVLWEKTYDVLHIKDKNVFLNNTVAINRDPVNADVALISKMDLEICSIVSPIDRITSEITDELDDLYNQQCNGGLEKLHTIMSETTFVAPQDVRKFADSLFMGCLESSYLKRFDYESTTDVVNDLLNYESHVLLEAQRSYQSIDKVIDIMKTVTAYFNVENITQRKNVVLSIINFSNSIGISCFLNRTYKYIPRGSDLNELFNESGVDIVVHFDPDSNSAAGIIFYLEDVLFKEPNPSTYTVVHSITVSSDYDAQFEIFIKNTLEQSHSKPICAYWSYNLDTGERGTWIQTSLAELVRDNNYWWCSFNEVGTYAILINTEKKNGGTSNVLPEGYSYVIWFSLLLNFIKPIINIP